MGANPNLLDRDLARQIVATTLGGTADVLRDVVDEGTCLLGRVVQTVGPQPGSRTCHFALILLLRHALELADAVDELFRAGCFQPAGLQARGIMETRMQMLFMMGARSPYGANPLGSKDVDPVPRDAAGRSLAGDALRAVQDWRARAYWVAELRHQLDVARGLEVNATADRLEDLLGIRTVPAGITDPAVQARTAASAAGWEALLREPENAAVNAEYDNAKGKRKFDPDWYELRKGPRSVNKLARAVGMAFQYNWFYSAASRTMHGADPLSQLGPEGPNGGRSVARLRATEDFESMVTVCVFQMALIYHLIVTEVRPEEERLVLSWIGRWLPEIR